MPKNFKNKKEHILKILVFILSLQKYIVITCGNIESILIKHRPKPNQIMYVHPHRGMKIATVILEF